MTPANDANTPRHPTDHDSSREYTFHYSVIILALIPITTYLLVYWLFDHTRNCGITFPVVSNKYDLLLLSTEAKLRYFWISAFIVSSVISFIIICFAAALLAREISREHKTFVLSVILIFVAVIAIYETYPTELGRARWYECLGTRLFEDTFNEMTTVMKTVDVKESTVFMPARNNIQNISWLETLLVFLGIDFPKKIPVTVPAGKNILGISLLETLNLGLNITKILGATALIIITVGCLYTLSYPTNHYRNPNNETRAQYIRHLIYQFQMLRTYLWQASIVFIFAVIAMISWMFWPFAFLLNSDAQQAYMDLVVGSMLLQGVGYTLAISAIYLPPELVLRHRVNRLASADGVHRTVEEYRIWRLKNGFASLLGFTEQMKHVTIVIAPAVLAAIPSFLSLVT